MSANRATSSSQVCCTTSATSSGRTPWLRATCQSNGVHSTTMSSNPEESPARARSRASVRRAIRVAVRESGGGTAFPSAGSRLGHRRGPRRGGACVGCLGADVGRRDRTSRGGGGRRSWPRPRRRRRRCRPNERSREPGGSGSGGGTLPARAMDRTSHAGGRATVLIRPVPGASAVTQSPSLEYAASVPSGSSAPTLKSGVASASSPPATANAAGYTGFVGGAVARRGHDPHSLGGQTVQQLAMLLRWELRIVFAAIPAERQVDDVDEQLRLPRFSRLSHSGQQPFQRVQDDAGLCVPIVTHHGEGEDSRLRRQLTHDAGDEGAMPVRPRGRVRGTGGSSGAFRCSSGPGVNQNGSGSDSSPSQG